MPVKETENPCLARPVSTDYVETLAANKTLVTLFIMNGFQVKGRILKVYEDAVLFQPDGDRDEELVYNHAISTIKPTRAYRR